MKGVFKAVKYIHDLNIVHRDLKPENILIQNELDLNSIKIADFGLSATFAEGNKTLSKQCGTVLYMAPEYFTAKIYSKV